MLSAALEAVRSWFGPGQRRPSPYGLPKPRPDGRWFRPLLPRGSRPGGILLLAVLSAAMLWCLSASLPAFMRHSLGTWQHFGILAAASGVFLLTYWLLPTLRRLWFVIPISAAVVGPIIYHYAPGRVATCFRAVRQFVFEASITITQLQAGSLELIPLQVGIGVVVVSHTAFLWLLVAAVWRRAQTPLFVVVGLLLFVWQWLFYFDPALEYAVPFLAAGTLARVVRHQFLVEAEWRGAEKKTAGGSADAPPPTRSFIYRISVYGLVSVLIFLTLAQLLPSFAPVNTGPVGSWFKRAFPVLNQLRGGPTLGGSARFSLARTGFSSSDTALGGPIVLDNEHVLTVTLSGDSPPGALYLRGAVKSTYTGKGWQRANVQEAEVEVNQVIPCIPRCLELPQIPEERLSQTISYTGIDTSSLFAAWRPTRVRNFHPEQPEEVVIRPARDMLVRTVLETGQDYVVESKLPEYSLKQLREFSKAAVIEDEDERQLLEQYLQLPPGLPERVRELAADLTADLTNPADRAIKLKEYVRDNYPYTIKPPEVPRDVDFVNHFLFESRRGYCSYHSTALAVLLRTVGIPSRWVIGYVVDDSEGAQLRTGTAYEVSNRAAHAWVEAFIPGYGWIELDPTPRFSGFEVVEELPDTQAEPEETDPTGGGTPAPPPGDLFPEELDPGAEGGGGGGLNRRPLVFYPLALLILAGGLWVVGLLTRLVQSYRADRCALEGPSGLVKLYLHSFALLRGLEMDLDENMTARELLSAMKRRAGGLPEVAAAFETIVPLLEEWLYGGQEPTRENLELADARWREAVSRLRQIYGLRRMLGARIGSQTLDLAGLMPG